MSASSGASNANEISTGPVTFGSVQFAPQASPSSGSSNTWLWVILGAAGVGLLGLVFIMRKHA